MLEAITALHRRAARSDGVIPLAGGLPDETLIPRAALAGALARAALDTDALQYGWPEGLARVRDWIAKRYASRGLALDPARVIVTAGAQQALAIAAAMFAGRTIGVGDATYPLAIEAFRRTTTVGAEGDVRYAITGISNPHGVDLGMPHGEAILDEAYAELRFDGRMPPPYPGWLVGTVSKTLSPGLRIGWLVPPADHHAAALAAKHAMDLQTCGIAQAAFAHVVDVLDYDAHLARTRHRYAARAERLVSALHRHVPELHFREPEGGFSLWCELDEPGDDVALLTAAIEAGVSLDPGSMFRPDPGRVSNVAFRLSFSHSPIEALSEGACRLATALAGWRRRPRA